MIERTTEIFKKLKHYCETENFKGWDPYDGLNSKIFQCSPLKYSRFFRLAWIQFFKRSCINFRKIFIVPKGYNTKGLGLFLNAYCNLYRIEPKKEYRDKIETLISLLVSLQSKGYSGVCWGYNFDWQARAFFQPKNTPTVVATSFISYAIMEAYELFGNPDWLKLARSSCDFVLKDLNRTYDNDGDFAFSYSPQDKSTVYNASLLGSKLLARVAHVTGETTLIDEARKSVAFCCKHQKNDGSWAYGTLPFHQWIDNFHTGFNLEAIHEYQKYSKDLSFQTYLEKGFRYYIHTFFEPDGKAKYYNNKTFPIDIHAPAQLCLTLYRMNKMDEHNELLERVLSWTYDNMFNSAHGYFYYQVKKEGKACKIPYMRWAQSWMMYALSYYLLHQKEKNK